MDPLRRIPFLVNMPARQRDIIERFWEKVDRRGPDECWPWTAARRKRDLYGVLGISGTRKLIAAHRLSWEIANGSIPLGLCILHSCDNPPCVNPAHLSLGTQANNIKDAVLKGRINNYVAQGEQHWKAKLTESKIHDIFRLRAKGWTQHRIAIQMGVDQTSIGNVLRRINWRHVLLDRS